MTKWERGPAPGFWMEENPPSGDFDSYMFDHTIELGSTEKWNLLLFLNALGVIEYGTVYETTDCIRIRVK